jgi:hypothetical protein
VRACTNGPIAQSYSVFDPSEDKSLTIQDDAVDHQTPRTITVKRTRNDFNYPSGMLVMVLIDLYCHETCAYVLLIYPKK